MPTFPKISARRAGYFALNTWLVLHLFAVMATPMTIGATSRLAARAWRTVSPYPQSLYLAHGFHYFAPEPGSSSLLKYTVTLSSGETLTETIPNRGISPRLLYHRHFMVTEYLGGIEPEYREIMVRAFADRLLEQHGAEEVSLTLVRHDLATMERIRVGGSLTEPDLYDEEFLGTFRWATSSPE